MIITSYTNNDYYVRKLVTMTHRNTKEIPFRSPDYRLNNVKKNRLRLT